MKKGIKIFLRILKCIGIVLAAVILAVALFFLVMTVCEYKPKAEESVAVEGTSSKIIHEGESISVLTWNVGYSALGETADFFMDGGTHVSTATKEMVQENIEAVINLVKKVNPDIALFQEVDVNSKRSHKVNQKELLANAFNGYQNTYACNYKVLYVPYPLPPIGKVDCGLVTLSNLYTSESKRIQLPCPFKWPVRLANLKRCLMVNRIPVAGSEKEIVVVNLHLEAYDSGEGKIAQTNMLREILETETARGNYVIAAGDFNQAFSNIDSSRYPAIEENAWIPGIIDVDEFKGLTFYQDNSNPSCRSLDKPYAGADKNTFQYYLIDGFIVSSNVEVNAIETLNLEFKNSDHNPMLLNVTLK